MAKKTEVSKSEPAEEALLEPRGNPVLFGHEATEAALLAAWRQERMPHALLITGEKGIGKATLAYRLARFILSGGGGGNASAPALFDVPAPASLEMKPDHPIFRRITVGSHADVRVISPAFDSKKGEYRREIVVEDTREIGQFLALTPAEGDWRVVIIDAADQMNRNAANALLKVLEEPPPRAILILISHHPGTLLATIRSRCQTVKCQPLPADAFTRVMRYLYPDMPMEEMTALAPLSGGSPGWAVELHRGGALKLYQQLLDITGRMPRLNLLELHRFADLVTGREAAARWAVAGNLLLTFLARIVSCRVNGIKMPEILPGEHAVLARLAEAKPLDYWGKLWEKTGRMLADEARLNLDKRQTLLSIFHALESGSL